MTGHVEPTTTALVLVPSPDLAQQYRSWIRNILSHSGNDAIVMNLASFVQALYRTGTEQGDEEQKRLLQNNPRPHILVATPARVLDLLEETVDLSIKRLDLDYLKLIVVDEGDTLLNLDSMWKPTTNKITLLTERNTRIPPPPAEQLLDYIFNARNKRLLSPRRAKGEMNYIQFVMASSSISAKNMRRWIEQEKRYWLSPYGSAWQGDPNGRKGDPNGRKGDQGAMKGVNMGFAPQFTAVKEGDLVSPVINTLQREETVSGSVLRKVSKSVKHYLLAYDMETGLLRDVPITRNAVETALKSFLKANTGQFKLGGRIRGEQKLPPEPSEEEGSDQPEREKKLVGDDGYPEEITVPILEKLLEYDKWPRQVLVGLGLQSSKPRFKQACEEIGINAEILSFEAWGKHPKTLGVPLGRSDKHLLSESNEKYKARPGPYESMDQRSKTTVWITDPITCAGLDCPGITHAYLFHRIETTKDYVAYCGRVSRHPFADLAIAAAASANASPGQIMAYPPPPGKVISIVLEEHITPEEIVAEYEAENMWRAAETEGLKPDPTGRSGSGYRPGKGEKVVRVLSGSDNGSEGKEIGLPVIQVGSMFEQDAYLAEGVKREKIGCVIEKYFEEDGELVMRRVMSYDEEDLIGEDEWGVEEQEEGSRSESNNLTEDDDDPFGDTQGGREDEEALWKDFDEPSTKTDTGFGLGDSPSLSPPLSVHEQVEEAKQELHPETQGGTGLGLSDSPSSSSSSSSSSLSSSSSSSSSSPPPSICEQVQEAAEELQPEAPEAPEAAAEAEIASFTDELFSTARPKREFAKIKSPSSASFLGKQTRF